MRNVLLASLMLFSLAFSVGALTVIQSYEIGKSNVIPFTISTNSWNYFVGDPIYVSGLQQFNTVCDSAYMNYVFLDSDDVERASAQQSFSRVQYANIHYELIQPPNSLLAGVYKIVATAHCSYGGRDYVLGADGYADANFDPDYIYVTLSHRAPSSTPLPPTVCQLVCTPGYRLVDSDKVSCYCNPAWTESNGKCELGEPVVSPDCVPSRCPSGQVLLDGLCVTPLKENPVGGNNLIWLVGGLVVIGVGLYLVGGRRGK